MPNKDELLQSITPVMKLDKAFFLKVYGYDISYPGFRETAIKALEDAGCSKAREYYEQITTEYEKKRDESIRPVAHAFRLKCEQEWERKVKEYERKKGDELREQKYSSNLQQKSYSMRQKESSADKLKRLKALV